MFQLAAIAFEAPISDRLGPLSSFDLWSFWITVSVIAVSVAATLVAIIRRG